MKPKTILISGGTSGIGKATALHMLEHGWNVAAFTEQPGQDEKFEQQAKTKFNPKRWLSLVGDVRKDAAMKKVIASTVGKFKTIDVLFNNAAIGYFDTVDKVDLKKFERMIEVNLVRMARMVKLAVPVMKKQKFGQVINMSSSAGKIGHASSEFYAATKSAVIQYSEGIRQELRKFGIKVPTICPGMVETNFWDRTEYNRRKKELWHGKDPVRLSPEDIAKTVSFVCSQSPKSDVRDITIMPF